uniref:Uncharacterized protein n=1 Tax=Rhodosorus marinus TaxID=101924 RepID=A0A7S2Z9W1_9RHOD|mmetsp:Transcript_10024/g.42211  ORF Transcript_10024/g.42211 Transcript_10024/m.42211 type:complete len:149 (+) Transcript_10024:888-1334(+)
MSSTALHRRLRYFDIGEELVLPVVLQPSFKLNSEALDLLFESSTSIILQWIQAKAHLIWEADSHITTETFRSAEYLYTMWMVPTSHSHMVLTKVAAEPSFYTSRTACPKTLMVIAERKSSVATQAAGVSKQKEANASVHGENQMARQL